MKIEVVAKEAKKVEVPVRAGDIYTQGTSAYLLAVRDTFLRDSIDAAFEYALIGVADGAQVTGWMSRDYMRKALNPDAPAVPFKHHPNVTIKVEV
jgi:hypothetical protein